MLPPDDHRYIAWQLADQARSCTAMGSPLYGALLEHAAADAGRQGLTYEILRPHATRGRGGALALRLMAAMHRLVLTGAAPRLAVHYPSVGGQAGADGAWEAFQVTMAEHGEALRELIALPCQTNEVGRCAGLAVGFLDVASRTQLELRLLEVGASAGLNLRWDAFRYGGGGVTWGPPESPVDLSGMWQDAPPLPAAQVQVVERRGCDPAPVDPLSDEGRLTLTASLWADQTDRVERLRGALAIAARVPARVDRASVEEWLPQRLTEVRDNAVTVVYHSIVDEYLAGDVRAAFHGALAEAGAQAPPSAPLAWVRLEPVSSLRRHALTVTTWPGGEERLLATGGAHGQDVRLA